MEQPSEMPTSETTISPSKFNLQSRDFKHDTWPLDTRTSLVALVGPNLPFSRHVAARPEYSANRLCGQR